MAKGPAAPTSLILVSLSVIIMAAFVILSHHQPSSPPPPFTPASVQAFEVEAPEVKVIRTSPRLPTTQPDNTIDIFNLQVGDHVGNLLLRTIAPADPSLSRTPQLDNFAITFQGKIALDGTYSTCFKSSHSTLLPRFSDSTLNPPNSICFDNPKTLTKYQAILSSHQPLTITLDNYTISRISNRTTATATLESATLSK